MPLYDYECKKCGCKFEKRVSMSEFKEPQECPECEEKPNLNGVKVNVEAPRLLNVH